MTGSAVRPLAGLALVIAIVAVTAVSLTMFAGGFTTTTPVTIVSDRAGLVMDRDAKVKLRGVEVGRVGSIVPRPGGGAELHLKMEPSKLALIPENSLVDIRSVTVFGAKFVDILPPAQPSPRHMYAGQVFDSKNVTVEFNTVFEQLTEVLAQVHPEKLNETLGAIATAFRGRGAAFGRTLETLDDVLGKVDPLLPTLVSDLRKTDATANIYADSADDLVSVLRNTNTVSKTVVDEQKNLDGLLVGLIGLSDTGNQVLSTNRAALSDVVDLLVPTLKLTNEYREALTCGIGGLARIKEIAKNPTGLPGLTFGVNFLPGASPYKYPQNVPKVNATGGPQCGMLPIVPFEARPKYVVTDTGVNPFARGNQTPELNFAGIMQLLFGPLAGEKK